MKRHASQDGPPVVVCGDWDFAMQHVCSDHDIEDDIEESNADRAGRKVPVIISSTAHYGKFASDVVELVGAGPREAAPAEMLRALGEVAPLPRPHEALREVVTKPPLHKVVVPADLDAVKEEIRAFLRRRQYE